MAPVAADNMRIVIRMTRSQQMALLDVLMEHLVRPDSTEVFINCSTSPPTETTVGDLLTLLQNMTELEIVKEGSD